MRNLVAPALIGLLAFTSVVHGQPVMTPLLLKGRSVAAPSSYSGPGDVLAIGAAGGAYSCSRAYSSATRGTRNCLVCNPGDAVCSDISSDGTTGIVAVPIIGAYNCNGGGCTVKKAYELSGTAQDLTQNTIANRPTLAVVSAGSAVVAMQCAAASSQVLSGAITTASAFPSSASLVMERTGAFTSYGFALSVTAGGWRIGWNNTANTSFFDGGNGGGNIITTISDSALHSVQFSAGGSTAQAWIDGSATASGLGTQYPQTPLTLCYDSQGNYMTGYIWEALLYTNVDITSSVAPMTANQLGFY